MDPVTWIYAGTAVVGAISAMDSADSAADNYRAQSQAAQTNAEIARQNARNYQLVANANEEAQRRKTGYALSQQRAALGQSGIAFEGSAVDVYQQSVGNGELDALNTRYGGQVQAVNALNQANGYSAQSQAALKSADNAEDAGYLGAASSLLSGGAKAYNAYKLSS